MATGILDEAYERLRGSGPERRGWLSNHAPMAAEALARHGREGQIHRWIDAYADRLEDRPRGIQRIAIDEWRDPLGDPVRTGDWLDYFARALADQPWRDVLAVWWPRLLPGIAAGATHGVIRVGHAVRALLDTETEPRVAELGHGLAYWAARWQPLAPAGTGPYRSTDPRAALDAVPRVPDQRFGIRARLAQLADLPGWAAAAGAIPGVPSSGAPSDTAVSDTAVSGTAVSGTAVSGTAVSGTAASVPSRLGAIVDAAVLRHGTHGYASPVMLVHAATAPNAVLRALPALPAHLWPASLAAGWAAAAAVSAAYAPADPVPFQAGADLDPQELVSRATAGGDPHAIKFVDTALDTRLRGADAEALAVAAHAIELIKED